jgi:hypothetical protein
MKTKQKQKYNTICAGQHYAQTNTNNEIRHEPYYTINWR